MEENYPTIERIKLRTKGYLFPSPPYLNPELLLGAATSDIRLHPASVF